jgi:hypothetical protein
MTIKKLLKLTEQHGDESGFEYQIGDLEEMLKHMWKLLTPAQRKKFVREDETLATLTELFEDEA